MGDPRRQRAKFRTPSHPWQSKRIVDEAKLRKEYGLLNKKEIWRMSSLLRNWQFQAREIVGMLGEQREKRAVILQRITSILRIRSFEAKIRKSIINREDKYYYFILSVIRFQWKISQVSNKNLFCTPNLNRANYYSLDFSLENV